MNSRICVLCAFLWLIIVAPGAAWADTRYVWQESPNPAPPYATWNTAAHVIQDAVDTADSGDTVLVTNGVYATGEFNSSRVNVDKPLNLFSVGGAEVTFIVGTEPPGVAGNAGAVRCIYLTNGASLTGFTLTNGWAPSNGGGVLCESTNAIVSNCVFTANFAYRNGGAVSGGTLTDCVLIGNSAGYYDGLFIGQRPLLGGGGAYASILNNCLLEDNFAPLYEGGGALESTLNHCTVRSNSAPRGGGAYSGQFNNCHFTQNSATSGGGVYGGALRNCALTRNSANTGGGSYASSLHNCTVTRNSANTGGGVYGGTLSNCIVYFNTADRDPNYAGGILNYTCTEPLPGAGIGNLANDPLLVNATHLSADSPCRNAGVSASSTGTDIDGEAWDDPPSIGCDEYHAETATGSLSVGIVAALTNVATGYPVNLMAEIEGIPDNLLWDFGDGMVANNRLQIAHSWAAAGDFTVSLTAYNASHPAGVTARVTIHVVKQPVHCVAVGNPTPVYPYSSWSTAATNIQDAVDAAGPLPGALVLVTNGTYATGGRTIAINALTNRVAVEAPTIVRSVNGPEVTLIRGWQVIGTTNGDAAVRCVFLAAGAILDGFTLTNGATRTSYPDNLGGGVLCESSTAVVSNCVLVGNSALSGGGSYGGSLYHCCFTRNAGSGAAGGVLHDSKLIENSGRSGGGASSSVLFECLLVGNTASSYGGGASSCTLNSCALSNNVAGDYGGGAAFSTLSYCGLSGNAAARGGGVHASTLNNCTLTGNSATGYGGGAYGLSTSGGGFGGAFGSPGISATSTLNNCVLNGNSAAYGGAVAGERTSSDCVLNNCTLTQNSASNTGGGVYRADLFNSIVYFNSAPDGPNFDPFYTRVYSSCTTPLPSLGDGNITADPRLASSSHLSADSPCIHAGNSIYALGKDIDGEPWFTPPSMGCDEFASGALTGPLSVGMEVSYTNVAAGFLVEVTGFVQGPARFSVWNFGDGTSASNQLRFAHAWETPGQYEVVLTAYNDGNPEGVSATRTVRVVTPPVHYVAADNGHPAPPYSSWETAANTIQDAVDIADPFPGTRILVSNGVYVAGGRVATGTMTNRVTVDKPCAIRSVNGPEMTIIDGLGLVRCAYLANGASLSGFTLANGAAQGNGGGVWCESGNLVGYCLFYTNSASQNGGGAFGGRLRHCVFADNSARVGGGAYRAVMDHCTMTDNTANQGGGAYLSDLKNCLLTRNHVTATGGGVYGSALYECSVVGNSALLGGGVAASTLNNCIVYYNTAQRAGDNHYLVRSIPGIFNYTCTYPMPNNGVGNITNAPLFVDTNDWSNLRLQSNSPCIDVGNNDSVTTSTDLDGNPRILNGIVDMGAYEFVPLTPAELVEQLIAQVNASDLQHRQPLLATLNAAFASIQRGNCHSAVGQLGAFQNKVLAQVTDAVLANELIAGAGQVITALNCPPSAVPILSGRRTGDGAGGVAGVGALTRPSVTLSTSNGEREGERGNAVRIRSLQRQANGRLQLRMEGATDRVYVVEASTNLVDWAVVGTATLQADGAFEFEDADANQHPCRFYRVVAP